MAARRNAQAKDRGADGALTLAGIRLTHPDRVLFAEQGLTKRALADYWLAVTPRMLPHAARRSLTLIRCPKGAGDACFVQQHAVRGTPAAFRPLEIREKQGDVEPHLFVEDHAGLVAGAQIGVLEFHIWGSRVDELERPDRLVLDLDPAEDVSFAEVRRAAADLRKGLLDLGIDSFALVTGGKGVHVVAPLAPTRDWGAVKPFARAFAERAAAAEPQRFTTALAKSERTGRIFIDYLRNERGGTAIAPYSTRAKPGAPVATPVTWDELARLDRANGFAPEAVAARMQGPDPWDGYEAARRPLPDAALAALDIEA
ncbi:MAG: non-homologous end-joining DNA ligase [Pseudomonadota bacterium]|nr:non-homologous end-joining DNA ligase [Pseudomonadota bacterium]